MNQIHPIIRRAITGMSTGAPTTTARLVFPLFRRVGRRVALRPAERPTHEDATRETIVVDGKHVAVYSWGRGDSTVLLVHGWQSRASRFSTLVRDLRAAGMTIVAFDAPANGESSGRQTDLLEYVAIIEALQRKFGLFDAIVGHSFGVLSSLVAMSEGVATRSIVGIAGVSSADYLVQAFGAQIGLAPVARERLAALFAKRVFSHEEDAMARFDAARDPAKVPMLLLHGTKDRVSPASESRRLHAANSGFSELIELDGIGHSRILDDDEALDRILAFIEANRRTAADIAPEAAPR